MHLSVTKDMYVNVLVDEKPKQLLVSQATGEHEVYDWFGNKHKIVICAADAEEDYYMLTSSSGEVMIVGETHSFLSRNPRSAVWERTPAVGMDEIRFVKLPQRKLLADPSLFDLYDADEQGIYLAPRKGSEIFDVSRLAAFCGIAVSRRKAELRVDLDRGRASCFASKLINGSFEQDAFAALSGLVASTVIRPPCMFNEEYVNKVKASGVVFEGCSYGNDLPLLPPRKLDRTGPVYHIRVNDPLTPVELTWCQS